LSGEPNIFALPKSAIFNMPSLVTSKLLGFKSLNEKK
jgi:hypothetical protein